ncbi:MAG: hypothetical protein JWM68_2477, partial [Verrucomicrobiales bacterium]|nr:hypothetical protein [Verrucomicrobiales bacterium]
MSLLCLTLLGVSSANAADRYWTTGACVVGGAGSWDNTSAAFSPNSTGGACVAWVNTASDAVIFSGANTLSYTVQMTSNKTVNKMTRNGTAAVNLLGSFTVTFAGTTPTVDTPALASLTMSVNCTGTITKTGSGRITLNNNASTPKWILQGGMILAARWDFFGVATGSDYITFDGGGIGIGFASTHTAGYVISSNRGIIIKGGGAFVGMSAANNIIAFAGPVTDGSGGTGTVGLVVTTTGPTVTSYQAGGTLILSNTTATANSYVGPTVAKELNCVIQLAAANQIPNASVVQTAGGQFDFNGFADVVGGLSGASGTITLGSAAVTVSNTTDQSYSGVISGSGNITQKGAAIQTLAGANTYSGGTAITAGKLKVANATGSATGTGTVTVNANGTLMGVGIVGGAVVVNSQGSIAANTNGSIGILTNSGSLTLAGGGTNQFDISDSTGTAGSDTGWDLIKVGTGVNITATSGSKFNVGLSSKTGTITNFSKLNVQTWKMIDAVNGLTNFVANKFRVTTNNIANTDIGTGVFAVEVLDTTNLAVVYRNLPFITANPSSANKVVGDTATFTVTAVDDL